METILTLEQYKTMVSEHQGARAQEFWDLLGPVYPHLDNPIIFFHDNEDGETAFRLCPEIKEDMTRRLRAKLHELGDMHKK